MNTRWVKPPLRCVAIRASWHGPTFLKKNLPCEVVLFRAAVGPDGVEVWRFVGVLERWRSIVAASKAAKRLALKLQAINGIFGCRSGVPVIETMTQIVRNTETDQPKGFDNHVYDFYDDDYIF